MTFQNIKYCKYTCIEKRYFEKVIEYTLKVWLYPLNYNSKEPAPHLSLHRHTHSHKIINITTTCVLTATAAPCRSLYLRKIKARMRKRETIYILMKNKVVASIFSPTQTNHPNTVHTKIYNSK